MDGSIVLARSQRKVLLDWYRQDPDPAVRLRAHILLLLAAGQSWSMIAIFLFCSTATIARWKKRFEQGGIQALRQENRGRPAVAKQGWIALAVSYIQCRRPLEFGFLRSRWCCATLVLVLLEIHQVKVSAETVRRWLHAGNLVWRRPRPILAPEDPQYAQKLRKIRVVLGCLSEDETAVFFDEVDLNTNPKIGCCWMEKANQATVPTPGTNQKRYLGGSMHWRTGQLFVNQGSGRNAELFCAHLDELRRRLTHYRKIHVICDNLRTHKPDKCRKVAQYLAQWGDRIELHYLPTYAPETNPIERVWWHLHEEITRNHRCQGIEELVDLVMQWLEAKGPFPCEGHIYEKLRAETER
jgi:putative transposase